MPKKSENRTPEIIDFIMSHPKCTSLEILEGLNLDMSVATLRRKLQSLVAADLINAIGELKSRKYEISNGFEIIRPIDMNKYFANAGIIGASKAERLIIDDSESMRTKHMRVFATNEGDGYYALLFQELTRQNYNNVMESFLGKLIKP